MNCLKITLKQPVQSQVTKLYALFTKQIHTHENNKLGLGGWKEGKSNVQIPKINTLFIWIFYKIPIETDKQKAFELTSQVRAS